MIRRVITCSLHSTGKSFARRTTTLPRLQNGVSSRSFHTSTTFHKKFEKYEESDDEVDHHMNDFVNLIERLIAEKKTVDAAKVLDFVEKTIESVQIANVEEGKYLTHWKMTLLRYKAVLHYDRSNNKDALEMCKSILQLEPILERLSMVDDVFAEIVSAMSIQSQILQSKKKYKESLEMENTLISRLKKRLLEEEDGMWIDYLVSEMSIALCSRAFSFVGLKRLNEALVDLEASISMNNENPMPYLLRAEVYCGQGQYEKSLIDVDKAMQLVSDPRSKHEVKKFRKSLEKQIAKRRQMPSGQELL